MPKWDSANYLEKQAKQKLSRAEVSRVSKVSFPSQEQG